jgi:hypothetical protein
MSRFALLTAIFASSTFYLSADDNFCRKCQVMRDYHAKNPSKYEYYDDYLKDLEENGEQAVNPKLEDLPEDVKIIMGAEKASGKKSR